MTTLQNGDTFLVQRTDSQSGISTNYQVSQENLMANLADDDLLLVQRTSAGISTNYCISGSDLKEDLGGTNGLIRPPVAVLTPLNGSGITEFTQYEPLSSAITAVGEAGTIAKDTDEILSVVTSNQPVEVYYMTSAPTNLADVLANGVVYVDGQAMASGSKIVFVRTGSGTGQVFSSNGTVGFTMYPADGGGFFAADGTYLAGGGSYAAYEYTTFNYDVDAPSTSNIYRVPTHSEVAYTVFNMSSGNGPILNAAAITTLNTLSFPTNTNFSGLSVGDVAQSEYATLNPDDKHSGINLTNGNLTNVGTTTNVLCRATKSFSSGKWYYEATLETHGGNPIFGWADGNHNLSYLGNDGTHKGYGYAAGGGLIYSLGGTTAYGVNFSAGSVIGVAADLDAGTLEYFVNGNSQGVAFNNLSGELFPAFSSGSGSTVHFNFGQNAWVHEPPSGYSGVIGEVTITAIDASGPSQTTEYATWDSTTEGGVQSSTFSADNLTVTTSSSATTHVKSSLAFPTSGKWYTELTIGAYTYMMAGVIAANNDTNYPGYLNQKTNSYLHYLNNENYLLASDGTITDTTIPAVNTGDVFGILLDLDAQVLRFSVNGTIYGRIENITNTVPLAVAISDHDTSQTASATLNAGQSPWVHTPPAGYAGLSETVTTYPNVTVNGGDWDTSNQSQVWSGGLTTPSNSFNGGQPATSAFDGDLSTFAGAGSIGEDIVFQPTTPVSYTNSIEVYTAQAGQMILNSDSPVATTDATGWVTLVSGSSGSINTITIDPNSNRRATLHAIRVDGKLLVDAGVGLAAKLDERFSQSTYTSSDVTGLSYTHNPSSGILMLSTQSVIFKNTAINLASTVNYHVYTSSNGTSWTRVNTGVAANSLTSSVSAPYIAITSDNAADSTVTATFSGPTGDRKLSSSISYEKSLTFTDTTELANMVGPLEMTDANGDVVTPVSDTIANVSGNVLTLQGDTNLEYFQPGDEVQTGVQVVSVDENAPSITVDGGIWLGADGSGSTYEISRSLRFNPADSAYLSRVVFTAGNRQTWTWSGWVKKAKITNDRMVLFGGYGAQNDTDWIEFGFDDDKFYWTQNSVAGTSTPVFRDPSAWQHVVVNYNGSDLKFYSDSVEVYSVSKSGNLGINVAGTHRIGRSPSGNTRYFDGYLADVHFIDGQALAPTAFGEFDSNGVWQAKEASISSPNNEITWSNYVTISEGNTGTNYNTDAANMFDGDTSTSTALFSGNMVSPYSPTTVVFTPPSAMTVNTGIRVYMAINRQQKIFVNGNETNASVSAGWNDVSFTGTLTSLTIGPTQLGASSNINAIEIDGVVLVDGATVYGTNGFHLDFSDNTYPSRLGTDKTGSGLTLPSVEFDGNDLVHLPAGSDFAFGTGDFTVEAFVRHDSRGNNDYIIDARNSSQTTGTWSLAYGYTGGSLLQFATGSTALLTVSSNPPVGKWFHLAVTRSGTSLKMFIDGTEVASATDSTDFSTTPTTSYIAARYSSQHYFTGNISNLRVVKGTAVYTSEFTVPTTPLANITNTKLLCFQTATTAANVSTDRAIAAVSPGTLSMGGNPRAEYIGDRSFTVNNLSVSSGYINDSILTGSIYSGAGNVEKMFDGTTASCGPTGNAYVTFTPSTPITINSSLRIRANVSNTSVDADFAINGSAVSTVTAGFPGSGGIVDAASTWTTISNPPSSLTSLRFGWPSGGSWMSLSAIEVDGVVLTDIPGKDDDSLVDTPTNYGNDTGAGGEVRGSYATLNPLHHLATATLANGNLQTTSSNPAFSSILITSGKWYIEHTVTTASYNLCFSQIDHPSGATPSSSNSKSIGWYTNGTVYWGAGYDSSIATSYGADDVLAAAIDMDNSTIKLYKNGSLLTTIDFTSSNYHRFTDGMYVSQFSGTGHWNFGQRPFAYAAPSGYKALCTTNLPEPTIEDGSKHFDVVKYEGNSSTNVISGLGFSPDLVWIKNRSNGYSHCLYDTVRGAGLRLASDGSYSEDSYTLLNSFNNDGFTLGVQSGGGAFVQNTTGTTSVAWAWNAGDTTETIAVGDLTSSLYDQSQTWSSFGTGTHYGSRDWSKAFDGVISTSPDGHTFANSSQTLTWTPPSAITVNTSVVLYGLNDTDSSTYGMKVNGSSSFLPASTGYGQPITIPAADIGGSLSSISLTNNASNYGPYLTGVEVDGKLLVDSGVSVDAVPSIASEVRANPTAGFSIVTWTGTATAGSVGHGLNSSPGIILLKNYGESADWRVWHKDLSNTATDYLELNKTSAAQSSSAIWNNTAPTSSVFQVATDGHSNSNGKGIVAYCFAPVEGYSAMGSYIGNGSDDGSFVYTGFKPAWIMIKSATSGDPGHWMIVDTKRSPSNPADNRLHADLTNSEFENYGPDILSNGFKLRNSSTIGNISGTEYIYMAFAENPVNTTPEVDTSGDTQVALDALVAAATEIVETDGTTMYLNGATGPWRTGLSIEGSQINAAPPGPNEVTFTSTDNGTTPVSMINATLSTRTWTLESGTTATGPWTLIDSYTDFDAIDSQDGATPWTTTRPTLQPNTFYRVKVRYDSLNADSVESVYSTFKTGDA